MTAFAPVCPEKDPAPPCPFSRPFLWYPRQIAPPTYISEGNNATLLRTRISICTVQRAFSCFRKQHDHVLIFSIGVPAGSPSPGGDVTGYVFNIDQPSLPTPFSLFLCLCLSYGPFNYISLHTFSQ